MGSNLFTSALSGMNAAQIGMNTTQHNIANANTPGFTRQEMQVGSNAPQASGDSFLGQGVDVIGVKRIYDGFLTTQVRQDQTQASYLSTYSSSMKQIDNMFSDPAAGASPAIQDFFNAANAVANNPDSVPARQVLIGGAQSVVNRFQSLDKRLTDISNGLTSQITSTVSTVNSYAQQIATINGNIKRASASSQNGQLPNDLLDQRDQLINQLNKEIKVNVQVQSDGTASVFVGNGQALVINDQAMALRITPSTNDPNKIDIAYQSGNNIIPIQQSSLQGGNLGAYLTFRDQNLDPARNALGRVALGLAENFNKQNKLGLDMNGALGGNIFNSATPQVDKGALNTGTATISAVISDVSTLTTSDYQLRFDGANYSVLRLSDNVVTSLGATLPKTVDGFTVSSAGVAAAGDTFMIHPTANGARDLRLLTSDPAKIAAAAPMRTTAAMANLGSGAVSSGAVTTIPLNASIQNNVSVTFIDATHYTVTDNTTATALVAPPGTLYNPAAGATLSFNGWTAQLSGTPRAGDTFTVANNTGATGDNRNALLMAGLQTQNSLVGGTASFQSAYVQLVSDVGVKTQELLTTSQAQNNMVAQTVASQQSISGVNLDEEAANLLRFQRAYQAAAKALQIANTMFDSLLQLK